MHDGHSPALFESFLPLPEPAHLPVLAVPAFPARIGKEHLLADAVVHFFAEMEEALVVGIRPE